ncbi:hypothetical protein H671_1g0667 [Cricetulus griseus]|nr:hypothetical protein H671_1g0667 [Cricetulus griseus]
MDKSSHPHLHSLKILKFLLAISNEIKYCALMTAASASWLENWTLTVSATTLFNIWTKYAPRLPPDYYNEKLLKVGDSLCQIKEYKLALLQCYRRYLQQFGDFDEHKEDVNQFKTVFFPKGFGDETAELTFHVLSSKNICSYKLVCDNDANLQNKESVSQCLHILSSLRLIMQVALPQEHLCWIIFNGTIYIYTICRKLMLIGLSAKALEYLLWASMCMESSAPLLSLRYLTWRATLYTAVCQCHYDCQTSIHGEAFARRALAKIDELRQLELMSSSKCQEESRRYYREATIKMAVMIFKRGVFESRRKNKAVFRPKIRINLKEAQSMVWPRTVTERLLDELFDCTASRFLAVLEALSDSSRRILQTGPLVTDEVELRDVVSELFMAGKELLILSNVGTNGKLDFPKTFFLEHMIERKNIISVCAAVKFTKLAFTYEEWGLFESLAGQLIQFLQKQDIPHLKRAEKDLILLLAVEPLINIKKNKGLIFPLDSDKEGQSVQVYLKHIARHESCVRSCGYSEDIFNLAAILHFCVCVPNKGVQPDKDIVVDIISFLWQKCKLGIQRINMSRSDFSKYSHKISTSKWIYLLWQISEVIHCYQMENLDIVMVAEITLRLSEILESLGSPRRKFRKSADMSAKKGPEEFPGTPKGIPEVLPILKRAPVEQLFYAYELLDKAIAGMNWNFMLTTLSDGSSTIDHCYAKYSQDMNGSTYTPISANSLMMDLHLELIHTQHRIAVVLLDQLQELSVLNKIRKNKLVRASYLMQKALLLFEKNAACVNSQNLLMEAYALIEKLEAEQNALYSYQNYLENSKTKKSRIPPPPILLARTHCSVTLKPAPFISDVKIPADGKSIFEIKGLETNEKYIFAIAAYSSNGKLIGDAVGETTKPILIYPPLSAVTARMYLTQVAYQIGNYELAKKVFSPVWGYFVASPPQDDQSVVSLSNIMMVTQKRMQSNILADTSSILLYLFLRNIFVMSDIKIKEENLFCDNIKGNEIFPAQQMARLRECENVLVALELSNFLNDSNYALQAVTQCYGLLAPIIYHNIVLVPVIQILIKCIVVLQAIPNIVHSKKQVASFESIQHMIACCVFYMAKIIEDLYAVMRDTEDFTTFWNSKSDDSVSKIKTQLIYESESQLAVGINAREKDRALNWGLDHFMKVFSCCSRAMVLAYRGGYWTLLQNCCRAFWNFAQELQILLKQAVDTYKAFPINQDSFLCACVLPFSLGTELLIDMLIKLQSTNSVKPVEDKGDFSVPSCYGNIKSDNGGSSLIFEHPLDDINVVDLKWIHDYVLKSLEILYQVEKWETLVSLAIQFNTISHERYTEQVTPLLVYAQRQLLTRIQKFNGPDIAQQACARYEADNGQKITCRNFIGKQLMIDPSSPRTLPDAEGCSDLLKMLILSEHQRAKQLVCVPVDVEDTLRCFRETLEKSKYHNRSVRHTKKLLLLFLAQTQGEKGGISNMQFSSGKVEFCLGTEEMHMSTPPDLSQENFRVFSSVEKSKLPYSQLGLVISSFYQTIDVLQDSNQRSLKVQLLHSLGSLFVFAEKKRAAFKCWCQALDDIFRKPDALHTWKEFGTSIPSATNNSSPPVFKDYSEEFLSKLGIWGCLQGAVIAAKIAQFIKTANVKQRTNCCILSALLFQSLLRTTLLHPKAEHSYAQYEITQLLPGIELFTDQFRADICSVIASLYYVIRELHYAKYNLIVLPLLALYQYFVTVICQDIVRNLEARILKAEILIDLGFFSEASYEIFQIFHGKNLPSTIPAGYKTIAKVKTIQSFDSGKPLTNKDNIQVLEDLVNKGLPLILVTLGHQHLLNKYNFVKAHFFISLAATINCIPDSSSKTLFYTVAVDKNKPNTPNFKDLYPKDNENVHAQSLRLRDESTLCMMKSLLLTEAEEKINSLLSDMDLQCHKPLCQCSAQELEILVEARLQLAAIALQRQRAPYGAAIVYSTLKLLQDSKIFKKRMPEDLDSPTSPVNSTTENKDDSEFLDPISLNAREYFNIHLWLKCRLMLVTAFIAQIRGIGIMKENDMTDCLSLINEVCMEAKSADDMEILAELLMQAVILGLQEKHLKADIIGNLQEIINLLDGNEFLSPPSWLTLVRSLLLMDDLTKAEKFKDASSKDDKLIFLNQAHSILIAQMLTFGETIKFPLSDADFANPQQPLKNIYLPHVILLAKVKLRIGHTLSKQVYSQNKKKDITKWLPSLHIFEMALKLCKVAALEECEVEAEILFQKGRIERQMLKEDKSPISQVESFFEAIQLSLRNDQNPGLIRDSYLEIALMYFYLKKPKRKVSGTPSSLKPLGKRQSSIKEHASTRFEKFSLLAWIAIRAAAQVSEAVLTINLLIGKKNARTDKVSYMALPNIPEFAIVDLLSSYTDYLLENYQVSFQTGSPFLQQNDEIYDSVDPKRKANNKVDITWILLIRYFIHLQRINNMSKLLASATPVSGISLPDDMLLTSLYNSELILRQKEMHLFLKKFLQFYSSSCIDEFPKELIQGVEKSVSLEKFLFETSGKVHRENSLQSDISGKLFCSPSYTEAFSEMAVQAVNKELCFQWYIPPLDKPPKDTEPMVLLLYAYNLKPLKISDIKVPTANNLYVGTSWIPLNRQDIQKLDWTPALGTERVISIHEKLSNLAQIAELSLPSVPEIILEENVYETVEPEDKIVDTDIDNMILDCCSEIVALFSKDQDPTPLYEVPFDISLPAIFSLERLFDLANGCIVSVGSLFNWVVSIIP